MIIKGRSLALIRVSWSHRVVFLGCWIDIFDPKIQIRHVDSRNQLADNLTKRHFTRDEWNHLLFNIRFFELSKLF